MIRSLRSPRPWPRRPGAVALACAPRSARPRCRRSAVKTPDSSYWRTDVERQLRHLLRVVDGEDEVRGVPGRAAGVRQRALVEQDEVAPAERGEVVGEAVADDARRRSPLRAQWSGSGDVSVIRLIYHDREPAARHASPLRSARRASSMILRARHPPCRAGSPRAAPRARGRRRASSPVRSSPSIQMRRAWV